MIANQCGQAFSTLEKAKKANNQEDEKIRSLKSKPWGKTAIRALAPLTTVSDHCSLSVWEQSFVQAIFGGECFVERRF